MIGPACTIARLDAAGARPDLLAQVEAIFWQASARTFPPGAERDAWLRHMAESVAASGVSDVRSAANTE